MSRLNSVSQLNPAFGDRLYQLMKRLGAMGSKLAVYETIRSPERQNEFHAQGRSRAAAYQSAHQFGLAADIVVCVDGVWTWPVIDDPRWAPLTTLAPALGLETLSFERPHVQLAGFDWRALAEAHLRGPEDTAGWISWLEERNKGGSK